MSTNAPAALASAPAWRQFSFFDVTPVKDAHDLAGSPHIFQNANEISTTASSSFGVLVADIHGSVHVLDKEFESVSSWIAHVDGRVTHMVERRGILVTLGEEDAVRYPLLKIWHLEKTDKNGFPVLLRSLKVQHSNRPHPVSTVALSATLSHLAIGLGDGTVLLYRHLDQSISSSSSSLTALPKPRVIHESPTEPITGLGFKEPTTESPNLYIFIATTNSVLAYQASGRGSGSTATEVDEVGAALGCAVMDWKARDMVVARDEAIYICGTEGRGTSFAYEGHKSSVHTHLNYLVIVSPPFQPSASAASATVRNFVARNGATAGGSDITKVTVFDLENKFVAYSGTFAEGVRAIISQWECIYVLSNDGNLSCLQEKPTSAKLDMLYRKSLYLLALSVAKTQRLDDSSVADIHRQYGDHLYNKNDYDGAMQQYLKTIGDVQPSYVIRKFLDAQRIHNLVTYLQELHSLGVANSDHTTLLLNTYTKLKDVARLDSFIKTESRRSTDGELDKDELPFDLDTAIRVCRQAGYFEHASYLAKRWERHEDYLRIQIEDAGNFKDALAYLRRLGHEAAENSLARYGRAMLQSLPEETTQLLIDICTSTSPLTFEPEDRSISPVKASGGASYLSYLALNRAPTISTDAAVTVSTSNATVKPGDRESAQDTSRSGTPPPSSLLAAKTRPTPINRPSPRLYFANFVGHRELFLTFLETVASRRWGQSLDGKEGGGQAAAAELEAPVDETAEKRDQAAVWNTLLELYLTLPGGAQGEGALRDKALRLLKDEKIPYDPTHALILCSTRKFTAGLVLLWERLGMYEDVLRFWMEKDRQGGDPGASEEVMRCLKQYGSDHPHLYPLVLRFLTSSSELLLRHGGDIKKVLEVIDEEQIMPPLAVVQVLSRNGVTSVGLVKEWLLGRIREAREEISTDEQLISSYRLESEAKLKQVEELSDPDHPRVFHVTQCSQCGGQLDLPSVHFMCHHSYHQRCLVDHETECPNCARAHGVIREIRRNNERLADQHELFLADVKENGFSAVAAGFGRGVLNTPRSEEVAT
ncbi:hypothetical protein EW146_g7591 [Bondarzewia mesenterica]|uniref:E3 ubiquitin-protein ligase PEP5 n=1 Tax=Bondarzewia mesenterica TaxID=1095465 RepID=A0A4S4LKW7_9AGAM|nr:hypothetical protein EW146_g7591 [Bondarzewia mesenterica]